LRLHLQIRDYFEVCSLDIKLDKKKEKKKEEEEVMFGARKWIQEY